MHKYYVDPVNPVILYQVPTAIVLTTIFCVNCFAHPLRHRCRSVLMPKCLGAKVSVHRSLAMTADHPPHPEARVLQLSNNEILTVNFCDWLVVTVANTIHAVINSSFSTPLELELVQFPVLDRAGARPDWSRIFFGPALVRAWRF